MLAHPTDAGLQPHGHTIAAFNSALLLADLRAERKHLIVSVARHHLLEDNAARASDVRRRATNGRYFVSAFAVLLTVFAMALIVVLLAAEGVACQAGAGVRKVIAVVDV